MTKVKFNLNFGGEQVRTLADLRENFSIEDVLDNYRNGTLTRWLDSRSYSDELEQVRAIQATDARGILAELIRILGVSSDPAEIEADLSLIDYLEGRKKFWEEIKANGLDGMDALRALRQELEAVKQERDALRQKLENTHHETPDTRQELVATDVQKSRDELTQKHGIKVTFLAKTLKVDTWKRIAGQGKSYRIIDPGNAGSLLVAMLHLGTKVYGMKVQDVAERHTVIDNGLSVAPDAVSCRLNETQELYFYYEEVK